MKNAPQPASARLLTLGLLVLTFLTGCGGGSQELVLPPPPVSIFTVSLPDGVVGLSYSATLLASNGTPPYSWSVATGSLPAGLTLNGTTGEITGTPTTAGTSMVTIRVTDGSGGTATKDFTIEVGTATPLVERVSLANDGSQANGESGTPAVDDTGRFVAFTSFATNLVVGDTNNVTDVFLRDRTCSVTIRVSVGTEGGTLTETNGQSFAPALSKFTGSTIFVAYASEATNLVSDDGNSVADIFVTAVDVSACSLTPVSTVRVNIGIRLPNQLADIFTSTTIGNTALTMADNVHVGQRAEIVAGTGAGQVRSITANNETTLTVDPAWTTDPDLTSVFRVVSQANSISGLPSLSADGSLVVYRSFASNLVDADTNGSQDAFVTQIQFTGGAITVIDTNLDSTSKQSMAVRLEVNLPDTTADIFSVNTIGNTTLTMTPNEQIGRLVQIVSGTGAGQARAITMNTPDTLTVGTNWSPEPDATSVFRIVTEDQTADIFSATTIGNTTLMMTSGEHVGRDVEITDGTGDGQSRAITANDATTFTVDSDWNPVPDATSVFRVTTLADQTAGFVQSQAIGNFDLTMTNNEHVGQVIEIVAGTGTGQARTVSLNGASTFSFTTGWAILPDATSSFRLSRQATSANRARLSGDGAFVAFSPDVFLHDRASGITTQETLDPTGGQPNGASVISALDGHGDQVLFQSFASNLVTGDTNNAADIFVRDRAAQTTERVSVDSMGTEGNGSAVENAGESGGGELVAFATLASNMVSNDRNGTFDVFLRDRVAATTTRVSQAMGGVNPNGASFDPVVSLDGTTVVFASEGNNLVPGDTNNARDIFLAATGSSDPPSPPLIVLASLPAGRKGVGYAGSLRAPGSTAPLFWTVEGGSLPLGLFLDPRTGEISGSPQVEGRFQFTVLVIDSQRPPRMARKTITLVVEP